MAGVPKRAISRVMSLHTLGSGMTLEVPADQQTPAEVPVCRMPSAPGADMSAEGLSLSWRQEGISQGSREVHPVVAPLIEVWVSLSGGDAC